MEITLLSQANILLCSIILGMFLGFLFDGIRITNSISQNTARKIFIKDVVYFIFSAVLTFIYILVSNKGEIRFFIISGEIIGWILYRITLGKFIYRFVLTIALFVKKWLVKLKIYIGKKIPRKKFLKVKVKLKKTQLKIKKKISLKNKLKRKINETANCNSKRKTKAL